VLYAVDRNRQVVGMYYHTANTGTFVPPGKGFSDMIYYADTDPHWPYKDDDGEEDLREGSAGWMLRQDPALAKKVKDNTQGYKDLKKWAGKPIPKKDDGKEQDAASKQDMAEDLGDVVKGVKRWAAGKPNVERTIWSHNAAAHGAESKRDVFNVINDKKDAADMQKQANRERQKAQRVADRFTAESTRNSKK
jgi:hypothetical protein